MKLGFVTLGMPELPAIAFATQARDLGYDGVGLRCTPAENGKPASGGQVSPESSGEELDEIRQRYKEAGVELSSLFCSNGKRGRMAIDSAKIDWDWYEADLAGYVGVAERLGCKDVAVQLERADERPEPGLKWDWDDYLEHVGRASLSAIKGTNLRAVYQNHVSAATAGQLVRMIEKVGDDRLGVILSPDHSIVMQENPVEVAENHPAAISHVFIADRRPVKEAMGDFDGRYYYVRYECCVIGEGTVPIPSVMNTLERHGWDGYAILKWEKSDKFGWQLPEGEAQLEPFVKYMRAMH